jgi:thiol:disulfide interchange protein DsbC
MSRSFLSTTAVLAFLTLLWQPAVAEDPPTPVLAALDKLVPGVSPDRVQASALPGLYEVSYGATVVYVSADGRFLIQGDLVEIASRTNYTRLAQREHRRERMARVDEADTIVFGPADAKYTVDVFTDIDCPYCVRLHRQMAEYNRLGVRIRYLAFPRAGIPSPSYDKYVSAWCSDDKQSAISDAKNGRSIPKKNCDNPVEEQFALGRAVGVRGTPSLILENGEMIPGYVSPAELLRALEDNRAG